MANRLAAATSPYLLQHADNPVDWREWGPAAFAEARRRDVPLLISIGYAACHWCHVMAHESFEDEATASAMNAQFVCVKVDREERPDIDAIYLAATQEMTGSGGWPTTIFATADGDPFYCGTYFPPVPTSGQPSFGQVLAAISAAWRDQRGAIEQDSTRLRRALVARPVPAGGGPFPAPAELDAELDEAQRILAGQFDPVQGGFGGAPKFPPSMVLEWLLRRHARTADPRALAMAERTLDAMARGGIYDQLGGGFARYCVDGQWLVPHFEKMLYDNALLLRVYAHWWRATGSPVARRVVEGTAGWLLRELRTPEGGFASSLDADSEGHEGTYYVWTPAQLTDVLGADDGAWAAAVWGVTAAGTFERGASVLRLPIDPEPADRERYESVRARLAAARSDRVAPARDDKVVAGWNGLAIAALAEAGAIFGRMDWVAAASSAAQLLLRVHVRPDGSAPRLVRTSRAGVAGTSAGVLEDYAEVADGLLAVMYATSDDRWFTHAGDLLETVLTHFAGAAGAGFFDTADDETDPVLARIRRPQDPADGPTPSGAAAAAGALVSYAALTGSRRHRAAAEATLSGLLKIGSSYPRAAGWGLAVAEAVADGPREVAIVSPAASADDGGEAAEASAQAASALRAAAVQGTAPGAVLAVGRTDSLSRIPLLRDRPTLEGKPTAYVCRGFVCDLPTTDPAVLARSLGAWIQDSRAAE